jgi:hypothetical protein
MTHAVPISRSADAHLIAVAPRADNQLDWAGGRASVSAPHYHGPRDKRRDLTPVCLHHDIARLTHVDSGAGVCHEDRNTSGRVRRARKEKSRRRHGCVRSFAVDHDSALWHMPPTRM